MDGFPISPECFNRDPRLTDQTCASSLHDALPGLTIVRFSHDTLLSFDVIYVVYKSDQPYLEFAGNYRSLHAGTTSGSRAVQALSSRPAGSWTVDCLTPQALPLLTRCQKM